MAQVAGLGQSSISRAELAEGDAATLSNLAIHGAALGLRLSVKLYPEGEAVRDAGQLRVLQRFRPHVHPVYRWTSESTVGGFGDLRAWDVLLAGPVTIGIDAETRLHDIQSLQRRFETKWRDSGVDRIVLLVADTRHNAAVLRDHREALRSTFPADTATVLAALRDGEPLMTNGIVVL